VEGGVLVVPALKRTRPLEAEQAVTVAVAVRGFVPETVSLSLKVTE